MCLGGDDQDLGDSCWPHGQEVASLPPRSCRDMGSWLTSGFPSPQTLGQQARGLPEPPASLP